MLPARFALHRPDTLAQALALLAEHGDDATAYAGGTELLIAMKARVLRYAQVVDIKRVPELHGIRIDSDKLVIGALSTHYQIAQHALVREHFPAYAELSDNVANIRVRVAGTIGGNLCFAEPHADPPALLCALDAVVLLAGPNGQRRIPMGEFILGEFTTARADGELMVAVELPLPAAGMRAAYRAFGQLERPAAGVAAVCIDNGGKLAWRFWVGALCAPPTRLAALEDLCAGLPAHALAATIEQHAPALCAALDAQDDLHGSADYKRHLASVLVHRAAKACLA
ncbi:xanthine dehydrogenase family protein subunit M [Lacisediminimonas sp.]|uniref:FAD binding domain-containing protein n=1 Tax=Lacisediminimonas sp. TaxID=3060582 RepID=UPI0027261419|nr:FAD binding domain-containing protein [Lacisediminimonas sp.]MDO8299714.1 FAD binding domain-containing protein [Lacisediminimonas sp.]MDO9216063.1 FAD binding domain-containing protein [Lacisediminimonas sp.]